MAEPPPLAVYGGLRRCADDAGRLLLLDLAGAAGDALADLIDGLAPFASAVVLEAAQAPAWYRRGAAWQGRLFHAAAPADVALAKRQGADAVIAGPGLAAAAASHEIARVGADGGADVVVGTCPGKTWIEALQDTRESLPPGCAGYLAAPPFWHAAATQPDAARRRTLIADDLVPRLQRVNAAMLDLPPPSWIDTMLVEMHP